jgi:hypothetical protein
VGLAKPLFYRGQGPRCVPRQYVETYSSTERATLPPLPVIIHDAEEDFEAESIIGHRRQRGKYQYPGEGARVAAIGVNVGRQETVDPPRLRPQAFSRGSGTQVLCENGSCYERYG